MVISSFCLVFKKIINFKKDSFKNCLVEKSKKSDAVSIAESQPTNEPQAQKPVEKMLQSKEAQRRIERYQIFEKFLNEQTHDDNFFSKQIPGDERAELMQGYYMLCVCSGSRWGGDKMTFLISFGETEFITLWSVRKSRTKSLSERSEEHL